MLQGGDLSEFATELEDDTLSDIFLQPPLAKHLHIIAQLPFGECSCLFRAYELLVFHHIGILRARIDLLAQL